MGCIVYLNLSLKLLFVIWLKGYALSKRTCALEEKMIISEKRWLNMVDQFKIFIASNLFLVPVVFVA